MTIRREVGLDYRQQKSRPLGPEEERKEAGPSSFHLIFGHSTSRWCLGLSCPKVVVQTSASRHLRARGRNPSIDLEEGWCLATELKAPVLGSLNSLPAGAALMMFRCPSPRSPVGLRYEPNSHRHRQGGLRCRRQSFRNL